MADRARNRVPPSAAQRPQQRPGPRSESAQSQRSQPNGRITPQPQQRWDDLQKPQTLRNAPTGYRRGQSISSDAQYADDAPSDASRSPDRASAATPTSPGFQGQEGGSDDGRNPSDASAGAQSPDDDPPSPRSRANSGPVPDDGDDYDDDERSPRDSAPPQQQSRDIPGARSVTSSRSDQRARARAPSSVSRSTDPYQSNYDSQSRGAPSTAGQSRDFNSKPARKPLAPSVTSQPRFMNQDIASTNGSRGARPSLSHDNDMISGHLLLDTAMNDCQDYHILSIEEVDQHKAKLKLLNGKILQERRKLAMELKVQNAAQNISKLYENTVSPTTARKKNRHAISILIEPKKAQELNTTLEASKEEALKTERKIHELQQFINGMTADKSIRESSLYRHSSAVLLAAYHDEVEARQDGRSNDDGERTLTSDTTLIDDIDPTQSEQLNVLQGRLEALNSHIAASIDRYRQARGLAPSELSTDREVESSANAKDISSRIGVQVNMLERKVFVLDHECSPTKLFQDVDSQLRTLASRTDSALQSLQQPMDNPLPAGLVETSVIIDHLDRGVSQLEDALHATGSVTDGHKQAYAEKCGELDEVSQKFKQVWAQNALGTAPGQDFSMDTFDSAVTRRFESLNERNSILQQQLQQQRTLPVQAANNEQLRELQELRTTHAGLQEMHTDLALRHEATEGQMQAMTLDRDRVMSEMERLGSVAKKHSEQRQQAIDDTTQLHQRIHELESNIREYDEELASVRGAPGHEDVARMHEKIVELTTELAETKAELDRARGSRAERAKDITMHPQMQSQLDKLQQLEQDNARLSQDLASSRAQQDGGQMNLKRELSDLANEHQSMIREREQLENNVGMLQQKCNALEAQLDDEKVRNLDTRSPAQSSSGDGRQATSTSVLKDEFKKMMRTARNGSQRQIRVSFLMIQGL